MSDWILTAVYIVLIGAALQDVAMLRISNLFPIALLLLFGGWLYACGVPSTLWQNGVLFLLIFALGLALFAVKWLGGGDVKLLAASALWFDLHGGLALFVYMTLCGGLLGLVFIFVRRIIPAPVREKSGWKGLKTRGPIPYGIAIAAGMLLTLALQGPNPSGRTDISQIKLKAFPEEPAVK